MIMHHFANHHNAISLPYLIGRQLCDRAIHNPYKYIRTHVRNTQGTLPTRLWRQHIVAVAVAWTVLASVATLLLATQLESTLSLSHRLLASLA